MIPHLDMVGVVGSSPIAPTRTDARKSFEIKDLRAFLWPAALASCGYELDGVPKVCRIGSTGLPDFGGSTLAREGYEWVIHPRVV